MGKMVVDDLCTNDIHGDCIGGWPPLVNKAMSVKHTVDVNTKKFDPARKQELLQSLEKLLNNTVNDIHKIEMKRAHSRPNCIKYGFKAPVSMTLTPWWHDVL